MDSNNPFVRGCYRKLCLWGRRTPIEIDKPYEGGPTPLFHSPQKKFYYALTGLNLLLFVLVLVYYVVTFKVEKVLKKGLCINIDSVYLIVIFILGVSFALYLNLARVEIATD
jgi:hypothetical protein